MTTFANLIVDCQLGDICKNTYCQGKRYLCFTHALDNSFVICVSDGIELWRLKLSEEDLETRKDIIEISTLKGYLEKIRSCLTAGNINVSCVGNRVTLSLENEKEVMDFELFEASAADKKTELQHALFHLVDTVQDLEIKLASANKNLDSAKNDSNGNAGAAAFFDLTASKKKTQAKPRPKQPGMSVVNPGSKKRKAAQGVVFD